MLLIKIAGLLIVFWVLMKMEGFCLADTLADLLRISNKSHALSTIFWMVAIIMPIYVGVIGRCRQEGHT